MAEISSGVSGASQAYNSAAVRSAENMQRDRKVANDSDIERRDAERAAELRSREERRAADRDRGRHVDMRV